MSADSPIKTWFITGCSSGFGHCIAEAALARGQRVIATARNIKSIAGLEGPACQLLQLDVTDGVAITECIAHAHQIFGGLDVIVNNAGYGLIGAVEECSDEQIRRNMETNYFGPLNVIRAVLPHLREQRSGHIVNISAAAALSNYAGFGIYGGAKAALELMSESLSAELKPLGIKVTLVQPGPYRTNFISRSLLKVDQAIGDYAATSGKFAAFLASMDGRQPGDPAKAAELIVQKVLAGDAPLRLPLGSYMIKKMRGKSAALAKDAEEWAEAASSTDFAS